MTELDCRLKVKKERKMTLRSLAWVLGLTSWCGSFSLSPFSPLVLLTVLQGMSLNTRLWEPLCCVLGIMELLRHVVGWVFRI